MTPPGHASKQGDGNTSPNTTQPPQAMVYLQLQYLAPDETDPRNFPPQFPIVVRYGEDVDPASPTSPPGASVSYEKTFQTRKDGVLRFPARPKAGKPWKKFTLWFQATPGQPRYIYTEKLGDPRKPGFTTDDPNVIKNETSDRFFEVPDRWSLKQLDCDLGSNKFSGNGQFTKATGTIEHTKFIGKNWPRNIGSAAKPVQLVINPHWLYARFEFFDRYYGPTFGNPARDGHSKRISTPQLVLEGFHNKLNPPLADLPKTRSNWVIGADEDNLLQCLPWFLRKDETNTAVQYTGATMCLRFLTAQEPDKRTYIVSDSKTTRQLKKLGNNSPPAGPPGPERLKAYDLPRVWKSHNFFVRDTASSPPSAGKHFDDAFDAAAVGKAEAKATPLIFCLDDIVLTDGTFQQYALPDQDRVAVFWHTFSPPAGAAGHGAELGVYKAGVDPHWRGYPYSDIQMPVRHYITDYPDWTRLVVANGNLYDVFAERTPDSAASPPGNLVIGARAAVRWIWMTSPPHAAPLGTNKGAPNARTDQDYLSIQPFWRQEFPKHSDNPQPGAISHDEWGAAFAPPSPYYIGRFDLAHLRCTDWNGAAEVTTLLRYIRYAFNLAMVNVCPPVTGAYARPELWAGEAVDNIIARWNGLDAFNPARPWIVPNPSPPQVAPSLKSQVLTLVQYVSPPVCHFRVRTVSPLKGSYVNGVGDSQFRVNAIRHDAGDVTGLGSVDDWNQPRWDPPGRGLAAAHETGHAGSMPDEYIYANPASCLGYTWLHMAANPFQYDDSAVHAALMKQNGVIRTRYFWHTAEFLHGLQNMDASNWKIEHGSARNYALPHYPHSVSHPGRDFYTWSVRFNLRQRTPVQRHWFDSFLYFMGEESYTTTVLPAPSDGMLVVVLRIFLDLDVVSAANRPKISTKLYSRVEGRFNALNRRFHADFQTNGGARHTPQFRSCLLHFVPGINLKGAVDLGPPVVTWADRQAASPEHIELRLEDDGNAMTVVPFVIGWAVNAPLSSNTLRVRCRAADWAGFTDADKTLWINALGNRLFNHCLETLGLSTSPAGPGGYNSPPSYRHIVRTVMENAAPDPVIT
jgi:hypothetical protein